MKITVRCFWIPADITFDTNDVEIAVDTNKHSVCIFFKAGQSIEVDKLHYLAEKAKNHTV
jgi:hypothetical protein